MNNHNIKNVKWNKLEPNKEFYLFVPQNQKLQDSYRTFMKLTDIFPVNGVGMTTARDEFVIDNDKKILMNRIRLFKESKLDDDSLHKFFNISKKKGWDIRKAWQQLQDIPREKFNALFVDITYRPFENKTIFYHDSLVWRTVKKIMIHMLEENVALCVGRQFSVIGSDNYDIVFVIDKMVDFNVYRRGGGLVLPLYLYPERKEKQKNPLMQMMMFEDEVEYKIRQPNIAKELFENLKSIFNKKVKPEEIFYYVYAILYSNTYRTKYAEFLNMDFPRVPFTTDYELFIQLGKLGKKLADLHLLKSRELDKTLGKYPIKGNHKVVKPYYEDEKVWINKTQYFNNVKEDVWQYQVGGYQVCEKYLKDRKGRTLKHEEIITYSKIITALSKTIDLQSEIDKIYDNVEKTLSAT